MVPKVIGILITTLLFVVEDAISHRDILRSKHNKVVACYVASWATYRPSRGSFKLDDLRPEHCTHLIYAFAGLNATTSTITSLDPYVDLEENYGKNNYRKMTALRHEYPGLKVTLGIGGWNEGSANYSTMASLSSKRTNFINSAVAFLKKHNFDGLDLDWEFPGKRGGAPYDKGNFVNLVQELHHEFKKNGLILTAAISADKSTIDMAYDIPEISKYLDFIHVMAYDYHGTWNGRVLPNAPFNCDDELCVKETVKHLLKRGAPVEKLVLGLPMYGRTFILRTLPNSPDKSPLGLPSLEKGFAGPYTREDGFMGYNEICKELLNTTVWRIGWDEKSTTPYAINNDSVVVYDNPKSLSAKIEYVNKMNLAGVMVWSIDTDDFRGDCARQHNDVLDPLTGIDYPLMRVINMALTKSPSDTNNNADNTGSSAVLTCHCINLVVAISIVLLFQM